MPYKYHAAFENQLFDIVDETLVHHRGVENVRNDIRQNLAIEFNRCTDIEFGEKFAAGCPIAGCEPKDYLQRFIEIDNGVTALIGIRFHGLLGFPFIDILATSQQLSHPQQFQQITDRVKSVYGLFQPKFLRVLVGYDTEFPLSSHPCTTIDQYFVASPISNLTSTPGSTHTNYKISIEPTNDVDEASNFVARAYEKFFAAKSQFQEIVSPAENTELETCANKGLLAYIIVDDIRAGLLASAHSLGPLISGQCIIEQILTDEFRGRGIASVAQKAFINHLAMLYSNQILWGTIDANNHSSLATATRVGRKVIAAWHWLKIAE